MTSIERMNIVITWHVYHCKSTLVGRLLADTLSLPDGKLQAVKDACKKNGRVFEYAYLLDALDDEQKQGITIDSARIFFKSAKREYIIIDAPGHIEFLRNMLSGASRAAAAVLVIDAVEGVAENSKRHGLLLSLLGISQVLIAVNKLDALEYNEAVYNRIKNEYGAYLDSLGVRPLAFVPVSAREGKNISRSAPEMPWYAGPTLLEALDCFENEPDKEDAFFAMPVQDIYRFSADNDERRIYAGTVACGEVSPGAAVQFLPSGKEAHIKGIEVWNGPPKTIAGKREAVGFTLQEEIYVRRGEVLIRKDETAPLTVAEELRANLIWLGENPLVFGKKYLLKLGAAKVDAELVKIERFLGGSLSSRNSSGELRRHDCGSVVLRLSHPLAFTPFSANPSLGRFVIVDGYDAAGCGIVQEGLAVSGSASLAGSVRAKTSSLLDLVGNTPLIDLTEFAPLPEGVSLFGKAEFLNPSGSVKDRAVKGMIEQGIATGELREGKPLIDAPSGNTGIAYTMFGAALGFPVKIYLPANANSERKRMLKLFGAEIIETSPLESSDGAYLAAREEAVAHPDRYFYPDQYNNEENWKAHYKTTAKEIWEQTAGRISHFISGAGTSGTFTGTSRRLKELSREVSCVLVQPDGPFHGIEGTKHLASTLKLGFFDPDLADQTIEVSTEAAYETARCLALKAGVFAGISTGANLAAALELCRTLPRGSVVVTILCDAGSRYLSDEFWRVS